ncbi:MAG TPA: thioredoxin domain-containing protein [Gemmatimonadaceae bacterium]|nr:thioredoxin domain-containing protein [Gemmatimonadaceae bacterium]
MSAKVSSKNSKSSNTGFLVALGVIVAAGGGFIWWKTQQPAPQAAIVLPGVGDSTLAGKARGYTMGSATAPVEIIEFADFECPACGNFAQITEPDVRKNLVATGKVRYTFYDFPLTNIHQNTIPAAMAAACADDQGKFWEMHDVIFEGQIEWNGIATNNPRKVLAGYAERLKLDLPKWNACMDAGTHAERIRANYALGLTKQVPSTPTFFINGQPMLGAANYDDIVKAVDAANAAREPIPTAVPDAPAKP